MNKTLLTLSILALSHSVFAVENGTPVNATLYPSLVEMGCTGTIIGGKWVLTAWHCTWADTDGLRPINLVGAETNSEQSKRVNAINENVFTDGVASDISLWELERKPDVDKVLFLSNAPLTQNLETVFTIYGFGQSNQQLNSAQYTIDKFFDIDDEELLFLSAKTEAIAVAGDSGSPYLLDGKIVAITNRAGIIEPPVGVEGEDYHHTSASRISYSQDWILATIDGWHHQTIGTVDAGQSSTIEIQSLHVNPIVDDAAVSGDIELDVTNSSCMAEQVQPFDICTYTVTSENGYEGILTLADGQTVTFNKGKSKPVPPPTPEPTPDDGGSSGGSLGFLSLLGLLGLIRLRNNK